MSNIEKSKLSIVIRIFIFIPLLFITIACDGNNSSKSYGSELEDDDLDNSSSFFVEKTDSLKISDMDEKKKLEKEEITLLDHSITTNFFSFCDKCEIRDEEPIISSLLNDHQGKMESQIVSPNPYYEFSEDIIMTITVYNDTFEITKTPSRTLVTKAIIHSENLIFKYDIKVGMTYDEFAEKIDELREDENIYSVVSFENSSRSKLLNFFFFDLPDTLSKIEYFVYLD